MRRNNLFLSKELSKAFLIYSLSFSSLSRFIAFHIFSILSSSIHRRTHVCHPNLFRFDSQSLFNSALSSRYSYSFVGVVCFVFCNLLCSTHFIASRRREKLPQHLRLQFDGIAVSFAFTLSLLAELLQIVNNKNTINYSPNFMNFYGR